MTYEPRENDYVIWTNDLGQVHKGWVYFVAPHSDNQKRIKEGWRPSNRYASIEIGTKPRPQCDLSKFFHKRIHICLICPEHEWGNLEYVRRRVSKQDDSDPDAISYGAYKSQQHRPLDVQ